MYLVWHIGMYLHGFEKQVDEQAKVWTIGRLYLLTISSQSKG